MNFFKQWGKFMMQGSQAYAQWEISNARTILSDKKRLFILGLLIVPVILGSLAFATEVTDTLPGMIGGHHAYSPAYYSIGIFVVSILIGLLAGLITGCIGAGGGFVITPALMSAGIKGILAVGTDLFHIFAKA
ncbi:MAG: sulfite exporter TauE/SafE family protein, partial [Desulfobacteraceae bacterium]